MQNRFLKYIEENNLVKKGDRVMAAVSGGIDSMVMTDLLLKAGLLSGIAHCNFSLRGKDSDNDEEMVRNYALKHGIPYFSIRFSTATYAKHRGISIEMAARELRYDWFETIRTKNRYNSVAVAHNLNDNIETLLLNLIRGTGIAGLGGMKPSANHIIRPLLFAARRSIEEYCSEYKLIYREDITNADVKFRRNKIRHELIPVMKEINPSVETTLNETAERMSGIYDIVSSYIAETGKMIFTGTDDHITVNINRLASYRDNQAVMFELFRPFGVTGALLKDLQKIIVGRTGGQLFTGTHRILRNRNEIVITEGPKEGNESSRISSLSDLKRSPLLDSAKTVTIKEGFKISSDPLMAYLDASKISFPLIIRKWNRGDFFCPFGMTQKKKLSDYFIDRKFSRVQKEKAFIMESDGKIAWIIGERIDNKFRITESTKKALVVKAKN
jgi:tRNA(Ile)-lysidine synthase